MELFKFYQKKDACFHEKLIEQLFSLYQNQLCIQLQYSTKSKPHGSDDFSKQQRELFRKTKQKRVLVKSPDPCGLLSDEDCSYNFIQKKRNRILEKKSVE